MGEEKDELERAKLAALASLVEGVSGEGEGGVMNSKNKKKKKKKKRRNAARVQFQSDLGEGDEDGENGAADDGEKVEVVYVAAEKIAPDVEDHGQELDEFKEIFEKFQSMGALGAYEAGNVVTEGAEDVQNDADAEAGGDAADGEDDEEDKQKKLTRRQRKILERLSVAKLKQEVSNPEVVDQWDVTASDPRLLVNLKSYRHSVAVPVHWRQKRKYLQNKRGMHKAPFQLPAFIAETGIQKMRDAYADAEGDKSLKQKQREKTRPKMGKADIDYQVLHDAFFKFQTKPILTGHGDLYYELKEHEVQKKNFRPGILSEGLRTALGVADQNEPPPWLYNMQRFPPPPSYPYLKIPGFNAPIPAGAAYGYFPGGWGRPPVDAMNRPLYGDVFGMGWAVDERDAEIALQPSEKATLWAGFGEEESEESEEEEEEAEEAPEAANLSAAGNNAELGSGIETSTSILPGGAQTPADAIELRKGVPAKPAQLYTVVEEKKASVGGSLLGTSHVYDLGGKKKTGDGVEVTLNPEDFERGLDSEVLRRKHDQKKAEEEVKRKGDDVSDIVAEGLARKRKELEREKDKRAKRAKDLKF
ncbi:hypothetical protein NDN08_007454 [Rhodosorus marinus]|uniref:PSP proline-rich domain-containing protein n=1 Tax=Rhodosorus marinus TaxID=101924 RepID=A0AAV8UXL5_9RHOD|nr:hypothetical protein NDN08_007454 [Rhodosorus marinus]